MIVDDCRLGHNCPDALGSGLKAAAVPGGGGFQPSDANRKGGFIRVGVTAHAGSLVQGTLLADEP
jgi:hypothetical protein